jgi:hypothetical protein
MPTKGRKRSARKPKPQCQCQEQIKDILSRIEALEADRPKVVCQINKPLKADELLDMYEQFADHVNDSIRLKVVQFPPRPELERFITTPSELFIKEIARKVARSLPRKRRKQGARIIDVDRDHHPRSRSSRHSQGGHKQE